VFDDRTDAATLGAAASGDEQAMEKVVRDTAATIFAFLSGMLGDQREAEEGMQETFVRAARGIERYTSETDPEAWLFAIARRVAADIRPTPASPLGIAPPAANDAEWAKRSLRALSLELREVVVLKELMRWNAERIARALGTDENEVSHRLLLARTQLADNMRGADGT
jgi:RNA polymerase sigma-70 factor, ECF subfamily